jgi:hypothetical protein
VFLLFAIIKYMSNCNGWLFCLVLRVISYYQNNSPLQLTPGVVKNRSYSLNRMVNNKIHLLHLTAMNNTFTLLKLNEMYEKVMYQ